MATKKALKNIDMSDTGDAPKDSLQRAIAMGEIMKQQTEVVAQVQAQLKDANDILKQISEVDLPTLFKELGLTEIKLETGEKISVKDEVRASISKENNPEAIAWMIAKKFGGLIKTQIVTKFGKTELTLAKKIVKKLRALDCDDVTLSQVVHPQTLKAFVKEQLEAGDPMGMPRKLLGIHEYSIVKLTAKK